MKTLVSFAFFFLYYSVVYAQIKIFSGGNMSIGSTAAPATGFKMHVFGNSLYSAGTFSGVSSAYIRGLNSFSTASSPDYTWWGNDQTGFFHPAGNQLGISTGGNERIRFYYGGFTNYGSATFADNTGPIYYAPMIKGYNDLSSESSPDFTWYGNDRAGIYHPEHDVIGFTNEAGETMRISEYGNLLIGVPYNGGYRLIANAAEDSGAFATYTNFQEQYGYAHASYVNQEYTKNWVVVFGEETFYVTGIGEVYCNSVAEISDSSMKENIDTIRNASGIIDDLRGVSYNYKAGLYADSSGSSSATDTLRPLRLGFIAQEIEQVLPEVVLTDDKGVKRLLYTNIIPVLVEAFKEQKTRIDSLEMALGNCCNSAGTMVRAVIPGGLINNEKNRMQTSRLDQNIPNPFHADSDIRYFIPENSGNGSLLIFDMNGVLIKEFANIAKGESTIKVSAGMLYPGMFLYSLMVDGREIDTKRMIITK